MREKKDYIKRILVIAVPIMLSNLISQLQMLIDKVFIGKLSLDSMSAVGNASNAMWTAMNVIFSFTTGATIIVSQAYGAHEIEKGKKTLASLFKYNNVLGIAMFLFWLIFPQAIFRLMRVDESIMGMAVDYAKYYSPIFILTGIGASVSCMLQASQKTKIMVWYGVTRSLVNVALDYTLIFGHFGLPAMGVKGAALATTIAEFMGDLLVLIYVLAAKDLELKPSFGQILKAKVRPYFETLKFGGPAAAEELAWNLGNLYLVVMMNEISVEAAGIYSIVFGVELIAVALVGSIGTATLSLSGYEKGKGNIRGVWEVVISSLILCGAIAAVNLVLFVLFPEIILGYFTKDEAVIALAPLYLIIVGIDLFPKSGNMITGSGIKGYGEPSWMLKTQLFGTFFVVMASTLMVLVFHMGIIEIFVMVVVDETLRLILNYWKFCRISGRKRKLAVSEQ